MRGKVDNSFRMAATSWGNKGMCSRWGGLPSGFNSITFLKLGGGYIGVDRVFSLIKNEKKKRKKRKKKKEREWA